MCVGIAFPVNLSYGVNWETAAWVTTCPSYLIYLGFAPSTDHFTLALQRRGNTGKASLLVLSQHTQIALNRTPEVSSNGGRNKASRVRLYCLPILNDVKRR